MSYQRCPLCKGKGTIKKEICTTCSGEKIICKKTGLPPSKYVYPYITSPVYPTYPVYPEPFYPSYPITYDTNTMFTEEESKSIEKVITNLIFN